MKKLAGALNSFILNNAALHLIAVFKFAILIFFAGNYGLFRDEFYYIECSRNLDFGYVDHPPLSILVLSVSRFLFGESLLAIRIFAYAAGAAIVYLGGITARELGGGKSTEVITACAVLFSGTLLGASGIYSMNVFDILLVSIILLLLIRLIKRDEPKLWIYIGIFFGLALQNKLTPLFIGVGLATALILTKERKYLLSRQLWIGTALAVLIFLPHLIWQAANNFPTLEFMRNAAMYKNQSMGFVEFLLNVALQLNPFFVPFLLAALYFFFFDKEGKKFSVVVLIFIFTFLIFYFFNGKPYYMSILFPTILAGGAVGLERVIPVKLRVVKTTAVIIMFLLSLLIIPFAIPVVEVESFIVYSEWTGIKPTAGERHEIAMLPQFYADRFGWEEMTERVARVYNSLTEAEKKNLLIITQNYGEAGAINYYGVKYGLPCAVAPHNSFWLWRFPPDYNRNVIIIVGGDPEGNREFFEEVEVAESHFNKYGMPYENVNIYICRKPKMSLEKAWPIIKRFI